ncbi:hypothetical protein V5799_010515 [Amblyomma americanum]|uniref:Uncharacterized protein n=1 Tax=Amblyomma americanum TaxID=6943 RepID=A0AAQ4EJF4_AMBAM
MRGSHDRGHGGLSGGGCFAGSRYTGAVIVVRSRRVLHRALSSRRSSLCGALNLAPVSVPKRGALAKHWIAADRDTMRTMAAASRRHGEC